MDLLTKNGQKFGFFDQISSTNDPGDIPMGGFKIWKLLIRVVSHPIYSASSINSVLTLIKAGLSGFIN